MKTITLQDILIVSVPVSDQDRAKHFYIDQLGFDLVKEGPFDMAGQQWHWGSSPLSVGS